jgi:hypothetical protein
MPRLIQPVLADVIESVWHDHAEPRDGEVMHPNRFGLGLARNFPFALGAQALFGFQFAAVLTEKFAQLLVVLKTVHLTSLGVVLPCCIDMLGSEM